MVGESPPAFAACALRFLSAGEPPRARRRRRQSSGAERDQAGQAVVSLQTAYSLKLVHGLL